MYNVHCKMYNKCINNIQCIMYNVQCTELQCTINVYTMYIRIDNKYAQWMYICTMYK